MRKRTNNTFPIGKKNLMAVNFSSEKGSWKKMAQYFSSAKREESSNHNPLHSENILQE